MAFRETTRARLSPRGVIALGFDNGTTGGREAKRSRPAKPGAPTGKASKTAKAAKKPDAPEVGRALRTVYDSTLNEEIPPEMLDLLGRLG